MTLKETLHYLRISQLALVSLITLLEFISVVGFSANYHDEPTHGATSYYWTALILSDLFLGSNLVGDMDHIAMKCSLMAFSLQFGYLSVSLLNISPTFHGESLSCSNTTNSALTRCRLFLSNLSFAWMLIPTFVASLYISISRWNKSAAPSSIPMSTTNPPPPKPQSPHVMQKGVLKDGFLVFNDNNRSSKRMSLYSQRNSSTPHVRTLSYPNNFMSSTPNLLSDPSNNSTTKI
ncbi:17239_t:CDS:2 [Acaulospora morrowiae]|uniref:17239_t:CDS:1 n=1 Tax=Acaulospora morrowiae TaxID=94023 RepID=A0A9N8VUY5_9GLOM|nr:17239_t:CDS:2 [Acaulospora morrowiae]